MQWSPFSFAKLESEIRKFICLRVIHKVSYSVRTKKSSIALQYREGNYESRQLESNSWFHMRYGRYYTHYVYLPQYRSHVVIYVEWIECIEWKYCRSLTARQLFMFIEVHLFIVSTLKFICFGLFEIFFPPNGFVFYVAIISWPSINVTAYKH